MFRRLRTQKAGLDSSEDVTDFIICEDCYRASHYGQGNYVKVYKHCILTEAINPRASRKICRCNDVPHFDSAGRSTTLFPVSQKAKHRDMGGPGGLQCGLLKLRELVAQAKYDGMQHRVMKGKRHLHTMTEKTLNDPDRRTPTTSSASMTEEVEADKDIPFLFRKYTDKYPFGNVHMALRIGPLVIENGVAK